MFIKKISKINSVNNSIESFLKIIAIKNKPRFGQKAI